MKKMKQNPKKTALNGLAFCFLAGSTARGWAALRRATPLELSRGPAVARRSLFSGFYGLGFTISLLLKYSKTIGG